MTSLPSTSVDSPRGSISELACVCPLCHKPDHMKKVKGKGGARPLYGTMVCKKCHALFTQSRLSSFGVDLCFLFLMPFMLWAGVFLLVLEFSNTSLVQSSLWIWLLWMKCVAFIPLLSVFRDTARWSSPGRWLMGLAVVDVNTGQPIGWKRSLMRNVWIVPVWLLFLAAIFSRMLEEWWIGPFPVFVLIYPLSVIGFYLGFRSLSRGPRWGDGWARSRVVIRKKIDHPVFGIGLTHCRRCGYDLRRNMTDRCPECGEPLTEAQKGKRSEIAVGSPA